MSTVTPESRLGQLVAADSRRAEIFKHLDIDYCCGGQRTLADACQARGLDPSTAARMLEAVSLSADASPAETDGPPMSIDELMDDIIDNHHDYLRRTFPRLEKRLAAVVRVHGGEAPWMRSVQEIVLALKAELFDHLEKEEEILFPAIRQVHLHQKSAGDREELLRELEDEHAATGSALAEIREQTDQFTPPEWACQTFRTVLDELEDLEANTHLHVHKENNVLFPKVRALST